MQGYTIKIQQFEGPFDLLLFFIERDELDVNNIPISKITEDFLNYIKELENLNIDIASEFILVAATLMRIKAKLLIPRKEVDEEGNEIDPREELTQKLLEYKKYKEIIDELVAKGTPRNQIFMSGLSCGGIDTLRHKGLHPEDFNATISFMPNCWDRKPDTPLRKMQIDELKSFEKINALVFTSPVDGEPDWNSNSEWMKKDLKNIPGLQWVDTPGHTGKDITINGKKCNIGDKMKGGWEEAWPEGKKKLTKKDIYELLVLNY